MRLLALHIENFGGLRDHDETFSGGLNVRLAPNGWGKSTLAVFIKAMLYGLPATTRRSLIENERKRYAPWQGGLFGGSLDLEVEGRTYRIERTFGDKEAQDTLAVLSLPSGSPAKVDWALSPGERLFGVDAAAYERSTYLSQRPKEMMGDGSVSIQTKLNGLVDATDDLGNYDRALEILERRRKTLHHLSGGGGAIARDERRLAEVERELETVGVTRRALAECRGRIAEAAGQLKAKNAEMERLRSEEVRLTRARQDRERAERRAALQIQLDEGEEQKAALLTAVGGSVPTEEEIDSLAAAAATLAAAKRTPTAQILTEAESAELSAHASELATAREALLQAELLRVLAKECDYAAARTERSVGPQDRGRLKETLENVQTALAQAFADGAGAPTPPARASRLPWLLAGVSGVLALIVGFLWWPAWVVGGGLLVLSALLALASHARTTRREVETLSQREESQRRIAELTGERERLQAALTLAEAAARWQAGWREALGEATIPAAGEAVVGLERVLTRARRLLDLEERRVRGERELAEAQENCRERERQLFELLARYPGAPREGDRAVRWLDEQRHRLATLTADLTAWRAEHDALPALALEDIPALCETAPEELAAACAHLEEQRALWEESLTRERSCEQRLGEQSGDMDALESEREELTLRIAEQKQSLQAVTQAQKYLKQAREQLSERYLATMQRQFGDYMATLTGAAAPDATMDGSMRVKLRAAGVVRQVDAFSVGVRDLIDFCERLALLDALFEGERPFLILDDPFTNLDDDTTARAGVLLARLAERYQLLYLTCHESRVFDIKRKEEKNA